MPEPATGPQSQFSSTEVKYGQTVQEWFREIDCHKDLPPMERVSVLKDQHGLGHAHANARVAYYRANNLSG